MRSGENQMKSIRNLSIQEQTTMAKPRQIQAKHEYTYQDEDGKTVTSQTFIKDFTFFEDIRPPLFKRLPRWDKNRQPSRRSVLPLYELKRDSETCYESHATLARKHKTSPSTVKRRISDLKKLGLVTTEPNPDPKYDTLLYTALPLTDAHVIPPDQLPAAPNRVSDVVAEHLYPQPRLILIRQQRNIPFLILMIFRLSGMLHSINQH
jgi:hypothetical protein